MPTETENEIKSILRKYRDYSIGEVSGETDTTNTGTDDYYLRDLIDRMMEDVIVQHTTEEEEAVYIKAAKMYGEYCVEQYKNSIKI